MSAPPIWMKRLIIVSGCVALIPPMFILRARMSTTTSPRIHIVQDMDNQKKFKAQARNDLFADERAMRQPVTGTVARGELFADAHLYTGMVNGKWVETFPMKVDAALMARGRERYGIYCAMCHGASGYGDGTVAVRAEQLQLQGKATWVAPSSYHEGDPLTRRVGHLYNTIANGIRTMPGYGDQVDVVDRWAIVAYIKALQRSQAATLNDVPADKRQALSEKFGR